MNPVYETMTRVVHTNWTIRVWREESFFAKGPDPEVRQAIYDAIDSSDNVLEIFERVGKLPRISAIEILDPTGNGGLFYPDWK